jgi:hypothetical protein
MAKAELENLVKIKQLKPESPSRKEYDGMLKSAQRGLADAQNESIETDSQFDLAVEAAHKLALATLRRKGYRSENRITVFQTLVHTIGLNNADLQVFSESSQRTQPGGLPRPRRYRRETSCRSDCRNEAAERSRR